MTIDETPIPWRWTFERVEAAKLYAEGEVTKAEIVRRLSLNRNTLDNWIAHPAFKQRVAIIHQSMQEAAENHAVSRVLYRVGAMQETYDRYVALMAARAEAHKDVPGGDTGLIVKTMKAAGRTLVEEYVYDAQLQRDILTLFKQVAQELGQWAEKREISGANGGPVEIADVRERLARRFTASNDARAAREASRTAE